MSYDSEAQSPEPTIDRATVEHIAELAKLALSDDEITQFAGQLSDILTYAARLNALDTDDIPPTASVLPLQNVLRSDDVQPSLLREQALSGSADTAQGQFRVDAVWGDDVS